MEENVSKNKDNSDKNVTSVLGHPAGSSQFISNKTDTVPVMLIEDYTFSQVPQTLQNILKFFENHPTSSTSKGNASRLEILVGIIYVLMLEYGFVPRGCKDIDSFNFSYKQVLELSKNVPILTCYDEVYTLVMYLPSFSMIEVKLAIFTCSDDVLVNCFVKRIENGTYNLILDPLKYFISSQTNLQNVRFQYLNNLSRTFKDSIAFPVKHCILKQNGVTFACIEDLPSEVLAIIMKKLQIYYLMAFGHCHPRFYDIMHEMLLKLRSKAKASLSASIVQITSP